MPNKSPTKQSLLSEIEELREQLRERESLLKACEYVERCLEESEERFRAVTENAVDAIIVANDKGRVVFGNTAAAAMFGWEAGPLGHDVAEIIPPRHREAHIRGMKRYLETRSPTLINRTVEMSALGKDGKEFPIEFSLASFSTRQGVLFSAVIRDISRRARLEGIKKTAQSMMRHDLQSPLTGIGGFARLLSKDMALGEKQRYWAKIILDLVLDTLDLLALSRDLIRMEEGVYTPELDKADIAALVEESAGKARQAAESVGVSLAVEDAGPVMALVETRLVRNLLANLIKNAYEASPRGGTVTLRARADNGEAVVTIHNMGAVPSDIRESFFDPYVTSGKPQGTGLGTHSAWLMASAQRGEVRFTTSEEKGTTVTVRLPGE